MTTREADNGELPMPTTESPSETNHSSAADTREQTPAAGFGVGAMARTMEGKQEFLMPSRLHARISTGQQSLPL